MNTLAKRVKKRRTQLGLRKTRLAEMAGVHHSIICRIESGQNSYSRHLFEIAEALKVNAEWLVKGTKPMTRSRSRK